MQARRGLSRWWNEVPAAYAFTSMFMGARVAQPLLGELFSGAPTR